MPIPERFRADFEPEMYYHVYNRTSNKEKLFMNDWCYSFFLNRAADYLDDFLDVISYSLIPNHFHFIVQIKPLQTIIRTLEMRRLKDLSIVERKFLKNEITVSILIEDAFKKLFQSYTQTINTIFERKGNLFYKNFKRIKVEDGSHLTQLIVYVNANSLKHGLEKDFENYKWGSFQQLLSKTEISLTSKLIGEWFGGREKAIEAIRTMAHCYYTLDNSIED